MSSKSLRRKLFLTVSVLVISSGAIISLLVTHRYSVSLFQGAVAQAENNAHTLAQDAADKILINDLVALQKLLDDQLHSNEFVSYLFIVRDGRILTHTFTNGIPVNLISSNHLTDNNQGHLERIVSNQGERFLDIAWPIFSGKAGILRMGFSETPYRRQISRLWVQMSAATLGILVCSLFLSHLFIKRITQPLLNLTKAVEKVDEGNLDMDVQVKGHDEVALLAASFNNMLDRIKEYTHRLQEYTSRLEEKNLAHKQALKEIQWNYETQTVVNKLLRPSLEDKSLEIILQRALDLILSIPWLAFESKGSIFLVENDSDMLVMKAQSGLSEKIKKTCSRLPFGRCHCGRAAMTKKIQFASRIDESHEIRYKGIITHGHYCVPILYGGRILGVINVYLREGHNRNQREEEFLNAVANTLAGIIERKRLEEELILSERLAAVGETTAGLAHYIKNILFGLEGGVYVVNKALRKDDRYKLNTGWSMVQKNINKVSNLASDLLSYSKERIPEYENCSLNEIANEVIDLMQSKVKQSYSGNIEIIRGFDPNIGAVPLNTKGIHRCILNLVSNAIDACQSDQDEGKNHMVKVNTKLERDGVVSIQVIDNGCGVDQEDEEQLFTSFFSTKGSRGTGLGLAVTQKIVQEHGGTLTVDSKPRKGSTFTIRFPVRQKKD